MNLSTGIVALSALYCLACLAYVYRWRGKRRYDSLSQYLRKSWPIFAPLNCLLYMATYRHARGPAVDAGIVEGIELVRAQWRVIREEALALYVMGELENTARPGSAGFHDLGFRTFYKRGWRKFYLSWYGPAHRSARRLCPRSAAIIAQVPGIRAAMFSFLPPGAELTVHADPMACSLRYHLGLDTPNSEDCHIVVDDHKLVWRDGMDFVFDETYPHHVRNDTNSYRLILMCDVVRPMHLPGRIVNVFYSCIARAVTVPNTHEDRRGVLTRVFARVSPLRHNGQALKARHRRAYGLLKLVINAALIASLVVPVWLMLTFIEAGVF